MSDMIPGLIQDYCNELKLKGICRHRKIINKNQIINFSSNDYLSLSNAKHIKKFFQQGFSKYPVGSTASMVLGGYHKIHQSLEKAFVDYLRVDDALLFSSGYAANIAIIALLNKLGVNIVIDKNIHASIYDGLQLTGANFFRFIHNNINNLQKILTALSGKPAVVLTEGIFSMSGQLAPLTTIKDLCTQASSALLVDEAHSFGIIGPHGLGSVCHYGLTQQEVALRLIPFGKAFACQGAMIVGRGDWIEALLQAARSYIYSTALSPAITYGLLQTLHIIYAAEERRNKLFQLVEYFNKAIIGSALQWRYSTTPIQQLQLSCPHKAIQYANILLEYGIVCLPIRQPTVSKKETGLRIILNYNHEPEHIDLLISKLHQISEVIYKSNGAC